MTSFVTRYIRTLMASKAVVIASVPMATPVAKVVITIDDLKAHVKRVATMFGITAYNTRRNKLLETIEANISRVVEFEKEHKSKKRKHEDTDDVADALLCMESADPSDAASTTTNAPTPPSVKTFKLSFPPAPPPGTVIDFHDGEDKYLLTPRTFARRKKRGQLEISEIYRAVRTMSKIDAALVMQHAWRRKSGSKKAGRRCAEIYQRIWDKRRQRFYYFNVRTKAVSWKPPAVMSVETAMQVIRTPRSFATHALERQRRMEEEENSSMFSGDTGTHGDYETDSEEDDEHHDG